MIEIDGLKGLKALEGERLGPSRSIQITQGMIDEYARLTGDDQWIHCDPKRAASELPGGKTIAHGFLTLSLFIVLQNSLYAVVGIRRAVNYGANKLRFISAVPVDSEICLFQLIKAVEPIEGGVRLTTESTFKINGVERPAISIETIGLHYE
jgi:acyl dehydratase